MSLKFKYTEEELTTQLKNNNQTAFVYLYDNYSGAVYGIIYRMLQDKKLSEDALQETFIKIWYHIKTYDSAKGRLFTWIINIAKHHATDTMKSKSYRIQANLLNIEYFYDSLEKNTDVISKFDTIGIRKYVNCLKNHQKQIIDLAYFKGYTQLEISNRLLIPLGTVKTRLRAAIIELRKSLN